MDFLRKGMFQVDETEVYFFSVSLLEEDDETLLKVLEKFESAGFKWADGTKPTSYMIMHKRRYDKDGEKIAVITAYDKTLRMGSVDEAELKVGYPTAQTPNYFKGLRRESRKKLCETEEKSDFYGFDIDSELSVGPHYDADEFLVMSDYSKTRIPSIDGFMEMSKMTENMSDMSENGSSLNLIFASTEISAFYKEFIDGNFGLLEAFMFHAHVMGLNEYANKEQATARMWMFMGFLAGMTFVKIHGGARAAMGEDRMPEKLREMVAKLALQSALEDGEESSGNSLLDRLRKMKGGSSNGESSKPRTNPFE